MIIGRVKYLLILILLIVVCPVWAESNVSLGDDARDEGDYRRAAVYYKKALDEEKSYKVYQKLGYVQSRLGAWDKAADAYSAAVKMKKNDPPAELLENLGRVEYMAGHYENALDTFQSLRSKYTDQNADIWIARCFIKTKQWTRGQNVLLQYLEKKPGDSDALELLAYLFSQSGKLDEAITIHEKLIRIYPGRIKYLLLLAKAQTAAENYDAAIDTLEFANRVTDQLSKEAVRLLADLYIRKKMYRQAALCYQRIIIASDTPTMEDYFRLGYTYYQTGEFVSAGETFEKIKRIDPRNYKATLYQGHIAVDKDDIEKARKYYLQAVKINESSKEPCLYLAQLEFNNKNYRDAAAQFAKAISRGDDSVSTYYNHVQALIRDQQLSPARKALKDALKKHPENEKLNRLLDRLVDETIVDQ